MADIVDKSVAITWFEKGVYGYRPIGISNYTNNTAPNVRPGFIQVGNQIYEVKAAETPSGWSGIANSTQAFIIVVPSGITASFEYTDTAPTWDAAKQGWYNGNNRYIFAVYKDGSGNYTNKSEMARINATRIYGDIFIDGDGLFTGDLIIDGDISADAAVFNELTCPGVYTTGAGTLVKTFAVSSLGDGDSDESSTFTITEPCAVYGSFSATNNQATPVYMSIQASVDSGYTDNASDDDLQTLSPGPVAITINSSIYKGFMVLMPGTYRLVVRNESGVNYSSSVCAIYKYSQYGGGSSV